MTPEPVRARLQQQVWENSASQVLLEHTLAHVVGTLRTRGLEVLVLKGPTLARKLYARPDLRTYHDLDIVCHIAEYARLHQALLEHGYTCEQALDCFLATPTVGHTNQVQVFHSPVGAEIEVHFDLLQFGLRECRHDTFWREARSVSIGGLQVRSLSPTHQYVYLAAHAHRHAYSRLLWLIDLDLLVRQCGAEIDWAAAMDLARAEGIGTLLRHAASLTTDLLGTPPAALPPPTLEERLLAPAYRVLWPRQRVVHLQRKEHRRLLHFRPDMRDLREVAYGLVLVGRRREKLRALGTYVQNQRAAANSHSHKHGNEHVTGRN